MTLLRLLTSYLQNQGHFVAATDEPAHALGMIEAEDWDLVITDGALKASCGEEFATHALERKPGVRVLLITGSARAATDPALFLGILRKPFSRNDFLDFIDTAIDQAAEAAKGDKAA